jgi:hypothetical protein
MHMIFRATDHQRLHSIFPRNPTKIRPKTCLEFGLNQWSTLFGRKYAVHPATDERVHKGNVLKTAKK